MNRLEKAVTAVTASVITNAVFIWLVTASAERDTQHLQMRWGCCRARGVNSNFSFRSCQPLLISPARTLARKGPEALGAHPEVEGVLYTITGQGCTRQAVDFMLGTSRSMALDHPQRRLTVLVEQLLADEQFAPGRVLDLATQTRTPWS